MKVFSETGWRFWWLAALVLVADQLSKIYVIKNFALGDSVEFITGI
ncbi:MAG: hypothetical protein U5L01_06430 [Rheinheimera sp.]|nr:hypothetical protein [Rheinheimera sp.]